MAQKTIGQNITSSIFPQACGPMNATIASTVVAIQVTIAQPHQPLISYEMSKDSLKVSNANAKWTLAKLNSSAGELGLLLCTCRLNLKAT